jgi:hypothetical protein
LNERDTLIHPVLLYANETRVITTTYGNKEIPRERPRKFKELPSNIATSCFRKVMEKMVNRRLVYILEERKLIPEQQIYNRCLQHPSVQHLQKFTEKVTLSTCLNRPVQNVRHLLEMGHHKMVHRQTDRMTGQC